jgi:hypothetical protein
MNKTRLSLLALAIALIAVVATVPSAVNASSHGATVDEGFGCLLTSATTGLGVNLITMDSHVVQTPNGNTNFICHFDIPEGYWPTQTSQYRGFTCGTQGGLTTNTFAVVSTDGTAMLRCQIRANEN